MQHTAMNDDGREPVTLSWVKPAGLIGLSIVNFLLFLITLGIYQFWGKTEVRKRIWSAIRLQGEPLQYSGTGLELFLGFLIAFFAFILPITGIYIAALFYFGPQSTEVAIVALLLYVSVAYLIGVGIYRAMRYRLSRTSWRGIRGGLEGNSFAYGWTYFWTLLLIPFTLAWIVPWRSAKLQNMMMNNARFGSRPFVSEVTSGPLYVPFAVLWIGAVVLYAAFFGAIYAIVWPGAIEAAEQGIDFQPGPYEIGAISLAVVVFVVLVGLVSAWYNARMVNHFASRTSFEGATFRAETTAGGLIWLGITNFLIVLLSLGLFSPIAQARATGYLVRHMAIDGKVPMGAILQGAAPSGRFGEGVAQAFDIDAF